MSILPTPITSEARRTLEIAGYENRVLEDELMKDVKSLVDFGNIAFSNLDKIIDLTDINSIKVDRPEMKLPPGFIPIDQNATDFYSVAKPHNGLRSLRRGYYKLLLFPELIPVLDFKVWSMNVLFCEGPFNSTIYKYKCNVGPLLNKFAVCRNLTTKKFEEVPLNNKRERLTNLAKQTIYVSSAELVHVNETIKPYETKEVLWFVW